MDFCTLLFVLICVFFFVFLVVRSTFGGKKTRTSLNSGPIRLLLVLGSGGHTAELLSIVRSLDLERKFDATFVIGHEDELSEKKLKASGLLYSKTLRVQRARRVGQAYASSVWTTMITLFQALLFCYQIRPQLLICNGPATCIPVCLAARLFGAETIFVESFCRTKSLSLSGKIACRICDHVIVQWPYMTSLQPELKYIGLLV